MQQVAFITLKNRLCEKAYLLIGHSGKRRVLVNLSASMFH